MTSHDSSQSQSQSQSQDFWRRCSACKTPIKFNSLYWICSVSTCSQKQNHSVYCSVPCWEVHVPVMNHKNAWACEERSPASSAPQSREPRKILVESPPSTTFKTKETVHKSRKPGYPEDILVVASKLKNYIRHQSDFNTSSSVMDKLSEILRSLCDEAIEEARKDGRKTVMDRDF